MAQWAEATMRRVPPGKKESCRYVAPAVLLIVAALRRWLANDPAS